MALRRVNFVDAVADAIPRISQSLTATLVIGYIATPLSAANGVVKVRFTTDVADPGSPAGYSAAYTPVAGDRVLIISDRDMIAVLYKLAT